jgi:hypothetical protein
VLQSHALATLAFLKARFGLDGGASDEALEYAINEASRDVERVVGRRVVFRAPTESATAMVATVAVPVASGDLTLVSQPTAPGRVVVVSITDATRGLLAAGLAVTLTITGTVAGVAGVTEAFDLCLGVSRLYGQKFFTAVSKAHVDVTGTPVGTLAVGYSIGYLDYLSPNCGHSSLWLPDWPAAQVLTVHEDTGREYAAGSLLVEGTGYVLSGDDVSRPRGVLVRTSSATSSPSSWATGYRAVRVVWSGGVFTAANVPADLRAIVARTAMSYYTSEQRGRESFGMVSKSDGQGSFTRFGEPGLSRGDREKLASLTNFDFEHVYERGFDLEAA